MTGACLARAAGHCSHVLPQGPTMAGLSKGAIQSIINGTPGTFLLQVLGELV
jgi:hypothetical protein